MSTGGMERPAAVSGSRITVYCNLRYVLRRSLSPTDSERRVKRRERSHTAVARNICPGKAERDSLGLMPITVLCVGRYTVVCGDGGLYN